MEKMELVVVEEQEEEKEEQTKWEIEWVEVVEKEKS